MEKIFISSVSYESMTDTITVLVVNSEGKLVATVEIEFTDDPTTANTSIITTRFEPEMPVVVRNSAVLAARVLTQLDAYTTDETDIALVIDVDSNNPIEI